MAIQIIKLSKVLHRTTLSRSSIYRKSAEGSFPKQIKIGARSSGWIESEVDDWLEDCIAHSRSGGNSL